MNYKIYKIHHSRGKSDTNFYQEQTILNGAYSSLKVLRVSIINELVHTTNSLKKKKCHLQNKSQSKDNKKSNNSNENNFSHRSNSSNDSNSDDSVGERILSLIERVLLFKQELDDYFFENKINLLKFHLNNISSIIIKNISDLQNDIIKDCPSLKTSHIIRILGNFSDVISIFIETKPQDFYREIKDAILNQWEKNRIKIKDLYEKIQQNCNISIESEKEDTSFSIEHYELYQSIDEEVKKESNKNLLNVLRKSIKKISEEEKSIRKLKKDEPNTLYYLIKRKKEIMSFITSVTQYVLFSISRLYYDMDYYSIIISSLQFKIFYAIMYYIDSNKDKKENLTDLEKKRQKKVFHLMNHLIHLALSFNKNIQTGKISLNNGGLNSLSKYVLNNFIEIVSKCQGLAIPKITPRFKTPSLCQIKYKTKFYKCYLQRYKKYKDNNLLRIFMLYYNSKMTFWKSIMIVAKPKDDKNTFTCRTCEKEIPLDDIFLHIGCCKEQQSFYDKMKGFKLKIQNYITHLDIYVAKSNINITPINKKLFGKGGYLYKIIHKIPGCENDDDGVNFIKKLIQLYTFEKSKPSDYYEKKPEEISYIVSMSYFSLMIFLLNKISVETDQDLSEILGGIFCTLLQIFMNVQFLLYIKKSQTKNSLIKNKRKKLIKSINKENLNNSNIILYSDKNNKNLKFNNIEDDSDDEDFFNPELNFKSVIQKYKLKLSLNNMMIANNSHNSSRTKTNDRTRLNSNNNISLFSSKNLNQSNDMNFFSQKSASLYVKKKNKRHKTIIQNSSSGKVTEFLAQIAEQQKKKKPRYKKKRSHSNHSTTNEKLNLNKTFHKLNTFNYRPIGLRSLKMARNKSSGNLFPEKKDEKLNISSKEKDKDKDKDKSNDSLNLSNVNNSGSGTNIINLSNVSENENDLSGLLDPNINKSYISRVDSCLSRIDSSIHRIDSNISRGDSIDNNNNKIGEENNNSNNQNKNKYILSNNNPNFQLGYRGEQPKKNYNKLSLFGSNKNFNLSNKKETLFKKNNPNNNNDNDNNNNDSDNSSELDDKSSESSKGKNILVHDFEEDENDKSKKNIKKEEEKDDEEEEDINDFFSQKGKNNEKNDNINNDNNNDNNYDNTNDNNNDNNIIIHSSSSNSSDSNNSDYPNKEDEFYNSCQKITTKDYEEMLPNMIYIKPGNQNNINYEEIAGLFNQLMEETNKKIIPTSEHNSNKNNNLMSNDNINKDKDFCLKKDKIESDKLNNNDSVNLHSIKFKDYDNNKVDIEINKDINKSNLEENKNEEQNENINENEKKVSKFKLILPIAKGGYGSVGLYKNLATSDTYAIKTVDIKNMKEKKLSSSLKNEQNILKEINNDYVVNSYFIFQDKKNYYFVMEYLPGGDVYTLLSKNNLPKKTIQLIVAETILAVNYLHSIHIIHHDIKPENILISLKGHFKLSDFGLSKTLQEDNEYDVVQNLRNFVEFNKFPITFNLGDDEDENKDAVGTLNYMAPELFTDKYPLGSGIDYWAIGVLIFDLYSYSLPFEAKTQEEMRSNIIGIKIDWSKLINDEIKKIYGNIDPAVDLIKKFLKENPADRWGDKNLDEIKKHKFFDGFNWNDVQNIKNETIKEYVKQRVKENNEKIKQINLKNKAKKAKGDNNEKENNKTEDGYPSIIEINLTENEERYFFTERYDNLNKKNNELLKKKIAKEVNFKENISDLMLLDLE